MVELCIRLRFDDVEIELNGEDAKDLYEELKEIFDKPSIPEYTGIRDFIPWVTQPALVQPSYTTGTPPDVGKFVVNCKLE